MADCSCLTGKWGDRAAEPSCHTAISFYRTAGLFRHAAQSFHRTATPFHHTQPSRHRTAESFCRMEKRFHRTKKSFYRTAKAKNGTFTVTENIRKPVKLIQPMKKLLITLLTTLLLAASAQAQFTFTTNNGAITITGYNPAAGLNVVIPASTNGYPVTSIGINAFYNSTITNVIIPNSVTNMDIAAFNYCTGLVSVTIPNSITAISSDTFYQCINLANVSIPSSVATIGDYAFQHCYSLSSVILPSSITTIGNSAFQGCYNMTNLIIGSGVTNIVDYAFYGCAITGVTIPNSVINLGSSSFASCHSLTSMTIGSGVTSIGGLAFGLDSSLTNIAVSASNPAYSSLNGVLFNKTQTTLVEYAIGLANKSYIVPNSVINIGNGAFAACSAIANVTIDNNVATLGSQAFWNCTSLTNVTFVGNSPTPTNDTTVFQYDSSSIAYYLAGTTGWGSAFDGIPTAVYGSLPATPPSIAISTYSNTPAVFFPTATGTNFVLQMTTNLASGNWVTVSNGYSISGIIVTNAPPTAFFRLH